MKWMPFCHSWGKNSRIILRLAVLAIGIGNRRQGAVQGAYDGLRQDILRRPHLHKINENISQYYSQATAAAAYSATLLGASMLLTFPDNC